MHGLLAFEITDARIEELANPPCYTWGGTNPLRHGANCDYKSDEDQRTLLRVHDRVLELYKNGGEVEGGGGASDE